VQQPLQKKYVRQYYLHRYYHFERVLGKGSYGEVHVVSRKQGSAGSAGVGGGGGGGGSGGASRVYALKRTDMDEGISVSSLREIAIMRDLNHINVMG
jgi:serine/threonine protein kinase